METISQKIIRLAHTITFAVIPLFFLLTCSQALGQDSSQHTFSQNVPEQTIAFPTTNPYTKTPGLMTITFSGVFHATRLTEPGKFGISDIKGNQKGTFVFMPEDPSKLAISGNFVFWLDGSTGRDTDVIDFNFRMDGVAQDGSRVTFIQDERALITEVGVEITFGKTDRLITEEELQQRKN